MKQRTGHNIVEQIEKGSVAGGKQYQFNDKHNENLPLATWFQNSEEGLVLFIVFYTQACRWSQCLGCNLPSQMSHRHIPYKAIINQIDSIFKSKEIISKRKQIKKVILSNNGSILDQDTFSTMAFMYLLIQLNLMFPNLCVLCIETRIEYVELAELEFISRAIEEGDTPTQIEIAIGFEAFNDNIRNKIFKKGLSLKTFDKFVRQLQPYGYHLKCYFMQKPVPGISDEEAVTDIRNAIDYLYSISNDTDIPINMHLNPTFVAKGTILEEAFNQGEYIPPLLTDVARAAIHAENKNLSIFIGLYDEGLAVTGGSFIRDGEVELVKKLEAFNKTQNYNILKEILNNHV